MGICQLYIYKGEKPLRCSDTGAGERIYRYVLNYAHEADACDKEAMLMMASGVACAVYNSVGGADNTAIDGLFIICRMLGLRLLFANKYLYFILTVDIPRYCFCAHNHGRYLAGRCY